MELLRHCEKCKKETKHKSWLGMWFESLYECIKCATKYHISG